MTPRLYGKRGEEIQNWINSFDQVIEKFVILDDDSDMEHLLPYLIKTSYEFGLTDKETDLLIKNLN